MEFSEAQIHQDTTQLFYPRKKVGILGGTFNPIHNGHINMALTLIDEYDLDTVMLMPSANPPHKRDNKDIAPAQARLDMAALAALGCRGLSVTSVELMRDGYSYTSDTMEELLDKNPRTDYYFIIGSDSLFDLEQWHDFQKLFRLTRFICVRRMDHDKLSVAAHAAYLKEKYNAQIFVSAYDGLYISSTYIRERIAEGKDIDDFVPAAVRDYIYANRLYK